MKNKHLYLVVAVSFIFAILPFVFVYNINDYSYPKIPIQHTDDSLFYYSRIIDVYKGNYFIGNPYVLEHKDNVSPNFFVADWVSSAPLFLGFSLGQTIILNQILWFVVFGVLLFYLLRLLGLSDKFLVSGVVFGFLAIYWYMARPISMQVIYPFFLGFLILLYLFIENPTSKKRQLFLGVYAGLSLYMYTYLAQIMALVFIIIFLYSFIFRFDSWRSIFKTGLISFVLAMPFIFYTWKQISADYYQETLVRLGLLNTHMLGGAGVYYLLLCSLLLIMVYIGREYFNKDSFYFFQLTSFTLLLTVVSNVFTGIDLELAVHVGRFIELWFVIVFIIFSQKLYVGSK